MTKTIKLRTMLCPYCGYIRQTISIGKVYCGPHRASFGLETYPAVQMVERVTAEGKP
jgi:hypothetical protein